MMAYTAIFTTTGISTTTTTPSTDCTDLLILLDDNNNTSSRSHSSLNKVFKHSCDLTSTTTMSRSNSYSTLASAGSCSRTCSVSWPTTAPPLVANTTTTTTTSTRSRNSEAALVDHDEHDNRNGNHDDSSTRPLSSPSSPKVGDFESFASTMRRNKRRSYDYDNDMDYDIDNDNLDFNLSRSCHYKEPQQQPQKTLTPTPSTSTSITSSLKRSLFFISHAGIKRSRSHEAKEKLQLNGNGNELWGDVTTTNTNHTHNAHNAHNAHNTHTKSLRRINQQQNIFMGLWNNTTESGKSCLDFNQQHVDTSHRLDSCTLSQMLKDIQDVDR